MDRKTFINHLKDYYQEEKETQMLMEEKINQMILTEEKVRIPMEPGKLGLDIDEPLEKFKNQVSSGSKDWDTLSKELNTLYIYNKNKHPDVASKWREKREALAKWIESKRKENPDFGK